jgi:hypothetical protein
MDLPIMASPPLAKLTVGPTSKGATGKHTTTFPFYLGTKDESVDGDDKNAAEYLVDRNYVVAQGSISE